MHAGIRFQAYLGTVVGGRRGVEKGPAGGGFGFFVQGGREALFAPRGGKGTVKLLKRPLKQVLLGEFRDMFKKIIMLHF